MLADLRGAPRRPKNYERTEGVSAKRCRRVNSLKAKTEGGERLIMAIAKSSLLR